MPAPSTCESLTERPALCWFRDDLRLADNAALAAAVATGRPLVLAYMLDEASPGVRPPGGAAKWWLDKSLRALAGRIAAKGGRLVLRRGAAQAGIEKLVEETGADAVFWNRRYGPARKIDERIKAALKQQGVGVESFAGSLLAEPFEMTTASGEGYKVFTPFWKALQAGYHGACRSSRATQVAVRRGCRLRRHSTTGSCIQTRRTGRAGFRMPGRPASWAREIACATFSMTQIEGYGRRPRPAGPGPHIAAQSASAFRRDRPGADLARSEARGRSRRGAGPRHFQNSCRSWRGAISPRTCSITIRRWDG